MYFRKKRLTAAALVAAVLLPGYALPADEAASDAASENSIETLIVSAAREPLPKSHVGSALSVLDAKTLKRRQRANLAELLRSLPGIAVSRAGGVGAQAQLRLRGGEANHVKVMLDGIHINDAAQGDELNMAHLFNHDIEQVELLRGPQSSLWGSDALAGVISISSKTPQPGQHVSGFLEGGTEAYRHGGANFGWASEESFLAVGARQLATDGHNVSRAGNEEDGYDSRAFNLRGGIWLHDNVNLSTNWHYLDSETEFDSVDFGTGLPTDRDNQTDSEQLYGNLVLAVDLLEGRWRHKLSLDLVQTDNANTEEDPFSVSGFTQTEADSESFKVSYENHIDLGLANTLSLVVDHQATDFSQRGAASFFGDPNRDESLEATSIAAEYRGSLADNLHVQVSARHADNEEFDDATTWRANAAWQVVDNFKLRAGAGTGVKNPTFDDRFGFFTNFVGNPDLKPEKSRSWDVGVDWTWQTLDVQLTYFNARLEDEINGFVFLPGAGAFTAENESGISERAGLELSGRWLVSDSIDVQAAYTWLESTENEFGRDVDEIRRPQHTASVDIGWQPSPQVQLNLRGDHNGAQDDFFFPPVPPFQERVELADFTLVTLSAEWEVSTALSIHARVENALDDDYEEVFGFATPGRTFVVGFRLQTNRK